ncbi:MAG TPA: TetR/AcrR family transcriptional regulator [Polyangiaceae bacterium]|nr:TetR/AcrR family transcriptional regulator [Polyangiaceae bacterium]
MPRESTARRAPQQSRSKKRVEVILQAARELIGQRGNDAVSMREIAARASVPIASVYDYFPDKNAIIRSLMIEYLGSIATSLGAIVAEVNRPEEMPGAIDRMIDTFVGIFRKERELATIWSAVQANTTLRDQDVEDGRRIAEMLISRFTAVAPRADKEGIRDACIYAVFTIATLARIAIYTTPRDGARLIAEFKRLMRLRVESLIPETGPASTPHLDEKPSSVR